MFEIYILSLASSLYDNSQFSVVTNYTISSVFDGILYSPREPDLSWVGHIWRDTRFILTGI